MKVVSIIVGILAIGGLAFLMLNFLFAEIIERLQLNYHIRSFLIDRGVDIWK